MPWTGQMIHVRDSCVYMNVKFCSVADGKGEGRVGCCSINVPKLVIFRRRLVGSTGCVLISELGRLRYFGQSFCRRPGASANGGGQDSSGLCSKTSRTFAYNRLISKYSHI